MGKKPRGLYRDSGIACVTDEVSTFTLAEQTYRHRAYEPDYDQLPTKEEHDSMSESGA